MSAFFIYRLLEVLGSLFIVMYFLARGLRDRKYLRGLGERFGKLPRAYRQTSPGAVWLHAVSVGEVLSAQELLRRLRAELPAAALFVSTGTLAGRAVAEEKLRGLADGVFYAPIDYCFAVRRVLRWLRPRAVIVLETEIWPNLFREAKRAGAALVMVNARISDRAAPRYRKLAWFFRQVLAYPDAILAQTEVSCRRFVELGAGDRVRVAGNLKHDFSVAHAKPPEPVRALIERAAPGAIWIAASTMPPGAAGDPDEDEAVLAAFVELTRRYSKLLLILVPRKPERFDTAAELLRRAGVPFVRRSELPGTGPLQLPGVLLLDSIGELGSLFSLPAVVFMGGTLAHRGGHNILEPAFFERPIVIGPHMENFSEIADKFRSAGAVAGIADAAGLAQAVDELLSNAARRKMLGARARELAEAERGAAGRAVEEIARQYWRALPRLRPAWWLLGAPLAALWRVGAAAGRLRRKQRLTTPVVSVGGLTMGGAGKTPLVLWLARRFHAAGVKPAILTRGYRRQSRERCTILGPKDRAPASRTGDEAQAYLRAGVAPLGIGADRAGAGRLVEAQFRPDVFLLDDGFQHHRLERDLDVVVLDALDPFGGGAVFPLGRLREPVSALARAGIVVISRVEPGQRIEAIEEVVRRYSREPMFTCRVAPLEWVPGPPPARSGAFCGLGNPDSFWNTLKQMGVEPVFRRVFPDHHRYQVAELARMQGEAEALLTTEKDLANLPEEWRERVFWLRIGLEIDQAEAFFAAIETRLSRSSRNCLRSNPPP